MDHAGVNYRHRDTTNIEFQGTKLDPNGKGKAKVQSRTGRLRVEVELENLPKPSIYGPEYLTYVLWAITPEGRASNLGEIVPKDGKAELTVTTDLQAFGLILTAEPYFAVTIPSDQAIMENLIKSDTKGWEQPIETKFDVLQRGEYTRRRQPRGPGVTDSRREDAYRSEGSHQRSGDCESSGRTAVRC